MPFELPALPYDFAALEPHIDARTMEIHHDKHHQAYVDNANKALDGTEWADRSVEDVLTELEVMPEAIRTAVRNNGGGHANHSLFWQIMGPDGGGEPEGELAEAIADTFGGVDQLKEQVVDGGVKRFGSGWTWLVWDGTGLAVVLDAEPGQPDHDRRRRRCSASTSGSTPTTSTTRTAGPTTSPPGGTWSTGPRSHGASTKRVDRHAVARLAAETPRPPAALIPRQGDVGRHLSLVRSSRREGEGQ